MPEDQRSPLPGTAPEPEPLTARESGRASSLLPPPACKNSVVVDDSGGGDVDCCCGRRGNEDVKNGADDNGRDMVVLEKLSSMPSVVHDGLVLQVEGQGRGGEERTNKNTISLSAILVS